MANIYPNLTKLIGNTPLMEVQNIEKAEGLKFCSILQGLYDCSTKVKQN
jgi:hypothetical protein